MPRFTRPEFEFLDFAPPKRTPGRETIQKIGPTPLDPWMDSNERATVEDEPYTGWRLAAIWLGMAVCSIAVSIAIGYAVKSIIEALV